jgi:hypothetical protein
MSTNNSNLRAKIDEAKRLLPLPQLLERLGLGAHAKKSARCPFHDDEHESFSVFESNAGKGSQWKCHAGCGHGDEIAFLVKRFGISSREAIQRYLEMAGFPARVPRKSHEYAESPNSPESLSVLVSESPCVSVSHVSNGQVLDAQIENLLKALAAGNACTRAEDKAERKRFKLARDVRAVEKKSDGN